MLCEHCQSENPAGAFVCYRCGSPFPLRPDLASDGAAPRSGARSSAPDESPLERQTPQPLRTSFNPGTLVAHRYLIRQQLGAGSMGAVYRAHDQELDIEVALKVVRADVIGDSQSVLDFERRFKQELLLARQVSHPNVLRIHDLASADGIKYITMSYVEGADLAAVLREGAMPLDRVRHMAVQLASGLAAAHEAGIVHRDLKPSNVLIDSADRLYISDFGLAKSLEASAVRMTRTGDFVGTPLYASPEQFDGKPADSRGDIYALGLILYQMATGQPAFSGRSSLELMVQRVRTRPPSPKTLRADIPDYLDRLIMRCIEKDPAARYQAAREILADLHAEHATGSVSRSRTMAFTVPVPSSRGALAALGVLAVILLAAAVPVTRMVMSGRASPAASPEASERVRVTMMPFQTIGDDPTLGLVSIGIGEALTSKLFQLERVAVVTATAAEQTRAKGSAVALAKGVGAGLVVSGSVQGSSGNLRVTANVDDVDKGRIWSGEFAGLAADLLTLEDRIFQGVVSRLGVTPTTAETSRTLVHPTENFDAYEAYLKGRNAMRAQSDLKSVEAAIGHFEAALKKDGRFALAYSGIADSSIRIYRSTKEPAWAQRALSAAQQAQSLDDSLAEVHQSLGNVYLDMGRTAEAIVALKRATDLAPGWDDAFRRLGRVYLASSRNDEAIAAYQKAVNINPYHWLNSLSLGAAYLQLAKYPEAIAAFQRVIELAPDIPNGHNDIGAAYLYTGQFQLAVDALNRALQLQPFPNTYTNLAIAYASDGKFARAVEMFEKAAEIRPKSEVFVGNLADGYRWAGNAERANATYDRAVALALDQLKLNPRDATVKSHLALFYAKKGDGAQARRHMTDARAIAQSNVELMYNEALMFVLLGDRDKALTSLQQAFQAGYPAAAATADPDLRSLRSDPRYQQLQTRLASARPS